MIIRVKDLIKELKKQPKDAIVKIKVENWSIKKNQIVDTTYEDIYHITTTKFFNNENESECDLKILISTES